MKKPTTVEEYFAAVPEPHRTTLETLRQRIRAAAPEGATERLSYGMPSFHYKKGLVCYAAFKNHCSLFPMSGRVLEQLGGRAQAVEIDIEAEQEIAVQAGVSGTPTVQLFLARELRQQWRGVKQRSEFLQAIEALLQPRPVGV